MQAREVSYDPQIFVYLTPFAGIFLGLHYTSDLNSAFSSLFFFIREIYYGWCLRYLHSSGASFVFLFLFLHLGRAIFYNSYFYNPNHNQSKTTQHLQSYSTHHQLWIHCELYFLVVIDECEAVSCWFGLVGYVSCWFGLVGNY